MRKRTLFTKEKPREPARTKVILLPTILALILIPSAMPGKAQLSRQDEPARATLQMEVWRLVARSTDRPEFGWEPFQAAGQTPQHVELSSFTGTGPAEQRTGDAERTAEGLIRKPFVFHRRGEEWLGVGEIEKRIRVFTDILRDGFGLSEGPEDGAGRRFFVKQEPARVIVVDEGMQVVRMQLVYESVFPVALIQRRASASPAPPIPPPIPDASLLIQTIRAKHRSTAELKEALEVISGIRRPQESQHLSDVQQDPMRMRVQSDAPSASLIVTSPETSAPAGPPPQPVRQRPAPVTSRFEDAHVSIGRAAVSSGDRYLRLARLDQDLLRSELERHGRVEVHKRQSFRLLDGTPLTIEGGFSIPFIRYRPLESDRMNRGAKIGLTLHVLPVVNASGDWKLTILAEKVDFGDYPKLEKLFTDYTTALQPGDTLIARRWSNREIADLAGFQPERDQAAETIVLLTLRE